MPSVLDRSALEQSPLADLHLLANELGVDGFRRLRKPDLVDAILARQSGEEVAEPAEAEAEPRSRPSPSPPPRPMTSSPSAPAAVAAAAAAAAATRRRATTASLVDRDEPVAPRPRAGGGGDERVVEGAVELLANGSGFLRLSPPRRDRRRRLHLRRAGQALRARLRRPRRRPGARRAPLRALPVADPRRHHQRPPGRGGRRGHALRGPAGGVAVRAHRARLRGPDGQGDRVADAVRQGLARRDRRPVARGQERGAAAARRRARRRVAASRSAPC